MDIFLMAMLLGMGMHFFKVRYQAGRIALLSRYLGQYQIEKLMESLTQGYLPRWASRMPSGATKF